MDLSKHTHNPTMLHAKVIRSAQTRHKGTGWIRRIGRFEGAVRWGRRVLAGCVVAHVLLVAGCGSGAVTQDSERISGRALTTYTIVTVPVPSALDSDLVLPRTGSKRERAQQSLEQILLTIDPPDYLPSGRGPEEVVPEDVGADQSEQEPSLKGQHAYVAGRVAWLERDVGRAKLQLKTALRLMPESTDLMRLLGSIYLRTFEPARGAALLAAAVKNNPRDTYSLYLLGKHWGDQRKWDRAITTLAYALTLPADDADPALPTLIRYLLGNALASQGYDRAAIAHLSEFLDTPERFGRTTRMIRELVVLSRERDSIWEAIGDAQHRLARPVLAMQAYEQALEQSHIVRRTLVWRLIYSYLSVGRPDLAQGVVLGDLDRRQADDESLQMIRYLVANGADKRVLTQTLREHYDKGNDASPVVLALADLLSERDAVGLLSRHLNGHPTDQAVFRRLIQIQLAHDRGIVTALDTTVASIYRAPYLARRRARVLLQIIGDPQRIIDAVATMPAHAQEDPTMRFLVADALREARRVDEAIDQLRLAVSDPRATDAARIELARLLTSEGHLKDAANVIEHLTDSDSTEVIQIRVQILVQTGRSVEALALLDQAVFQQPNNLDLIIEKANVHLANGDAQSAEQSLLNALDKQPRAERLYEQLINLYQAGLVARSAEQYQHLVGRMMRMIPMARVARLERAKVLAAGGRYEQAEPVLRRLLTENPRDYQTLDLLLQALWKTERADEADDLLQQALKNESDQGQQILSVALQHYRRTNDRDRTVETAMRLVNTLIHDRPLAVRTLNSLTQLLTTLDAQDQVTDLLNEQLARYPKDKHLLVLARQHFERIGDRERSFDLTVTLLKMMPKTVMRQIKLAVLYLENDHPDRALEILGQVLEDGDSHIDAAVALISRALTKAGNAESADRWFSDALVSYPRHRRTLRFAWALHCDHRGDHAQAERLMNKLLQDHPDHADASNWLGYTLADSGRDLERAKRLIQVALDADPVNAAYLDSMGWALYKLGRFEEATALLERAQSSEGGNHPVIVDHLGDAVYRIGETDRAVKIWQRARGSIGLKDGDSVDPELQDLNERLRSKITAVDTGQQPVVAEAPGLAMEGEPQEQGMSGAPTDPADGKAIRALPDRSGGGQDGTDTEPVTPDENDGEVVDPIPDVAAPSTGVTDD